MEESGTHSASTRSSLSVSERERNSLILHDGPPVDDCCPICFGSFSAPCRGPCGHWYCGGCIMEYWNHVAAFRPCKCPMCSGPITRLTPEATLSQQQDAGVREVLKNVRQYNCLFAGGACGFILQVLQLPLFVKRLLQAMMDPDRPVAYLSRLRLVAVFLGALYTLSPFDFLPRWRYLDPIDLFDCSAIVLSFSLYFVGLYSRRRRLRYLRQQAPVPRFNVDRRMIVCVRSGYQSLDAMGCTEIRWIEMHLVNFLVLATPVLSWHSCLGESLRILANGLTLDRRTFGTIDDNPFVISFLDVEIRLVGC